MAYEKFMVQVSRIVGIALQEFSFFVGFILVVASKVGTIVRDIHFNDLHQIQQIGYLAAFGIAHLVPADVAQSFNPLRRVDGEYAVGMFVVSMHF